MSKKDTKLLTPEFTPKHESSSSTSTSPTSPTFSEDSSSSAAESDKGCFAGDARKLMPLFVFNMSLMVLSYMTLALYNHGVIRTLERRFGLNSQQTGFLSSCNDIIHICLVVFMGYFGTKANKPRLISVTVMFAAVAGFLMASPHFLLSDYTSVHERISTSKYNNSTTNSSKIEFCDRSKNSKDECAGEAGNPSTVHPAYYIFVLAQLISGVGSSAAFTLSFAYVDENAPKDKASFYIGILLGMYAFGPLLGLMLAAFCLTLPENISYGAKINTGSSSFIGCWWLGYLIAALLLSITALPLFFYPKKMTHPYKKVKSQLPLVEKRKEDLDQDSFVRQAKEFPRALIRLLTNKIYIFNLLHIICGAYIIYAIFVNIVRYVEVHFHERAFVGSIIAGLVSALAGALGSFGGGFVMTRGKLKLTGGLKMMLGCSVIFASSILIIMLIPCPQFQLHSQFDPQLQYLSVRTECNVGCNCALNRKAFQPICANNITYFSPCIAGCQAKHNKTYYNCSCIAPSTRQDSKQPEKQHPAPATNQTTWYSGLESAQAGMCAHSCTRQLIAFAGVLFLMSLAGSFARVPGTMVSFRIVKDEERSFALGINSFVLNAFGFIPSPLIFGYLIDKSCLIWERTCSATGVCILFDSARLRYSVYGLAFSVELVSMLLVFIVFMLVCRSPIKDAPLNKNILQAVEISKETDI